MRRIYTSLILVFLLINTSIWAQKGTVKGTITDAGSKLSVIGANVVIGTTGVTTDIDGKYSIDLEPGEQTIVFSFIGYTSQTRVVDVKAGETITVDIVLAEKAEMLETVVISGGKFEQKIEDLTVSMEVLKPAIVEQKGSNDMRTAVNQTPGVQIVDNEPQIRGGSGYSFGAGSRVQILVDDMPVLSGDAGRPAWSFLPIENLEQIEILKGASSVLYGSAALSGVINIRTAYPKDEPKTKININSGVYDNPKSDENIHWGASNPTYTGVNFFHSRKIGNLDLVVGANIFTDQGYVGPSPESVSVYPSNDPDYELVVKGALSADSIRRIDYQFGLDSTASYIPSNHGTFAKRARVNANLRYRPENIEGLNFGVNFNVMRSESSGSLLLLHTQTEGGLYRSFPGAVTRTSSWNYSIDPFINYYGKNEIKHSLRTRLYHNGNANTNNQSNFSDIIYGEYQLSKKVIAANLNITTGVVYTQSQSEAELYQGNEDGSGESSAQNNAAYLQLDKKFGDKDRDRLNLSAGARVERFVVNGAEETKPVFRAGASSNVFGATYLRASWGQGFRFPTIAEKFIRTSVGALSIYPNQNVQSESSWNAELGLKQGFKIKEFKGYLDVAVFRQEVKNAIEFTFGQWGIIGVDPNAGLGFRSINISDSRIEGLDISLVGTGKIGEINITTLLGYTYLNPQNLDINEVVDSSGILTGAITYKDVSSDTSGILKYRFQHMIKGDIQFDYKKLAVGVSYRYLSNMDNVDKIFIEQDSPSGFLPTGIRKYREENNKGNAVVDLRFSYDLSDKIKAALIVNNALNEEYMIRPLNIESPRTWALQFTMNL